MPPHFPSESVPHFARNPQRKLKQNRRYHRTQVTITWGSNLRFQNNGGRQEPMASSYQIRSRNTSRAKRGRVCWTSMIDWGCKSPTGTVEATVSLRQLRGTARARGEEAGGKLQQRTKVKRREAGLVEVSVPGNATPDTQPWPENAEMARAAPEQ